MTSRIRVNIFMILWFIYYVVLFAGLMLFMGEDFMNLSVSQLLIFTQLGLMFIPLLIYSLVTKRKLSELIPHEFLKPGSFIVIIVIIIFLEPSMIFLNALSLLFVDNVLMDTINTLVEGSFIKGLAVMAMMPAVFEELLFRGMVLTEGKGKNPAFGIFISGLYFGIMHLNFNQFFYAFFLGSVLAYFVLKTKSIFASITGHFTVNAISFVLSYVASQFTDEMEAAAAAVSQAEILTELKAMAVLVILSLPFLFALFKLFNHLNSENDLKEPEVLNFDSAGKEEIFLDENDYDMDPTAELTIENPAKDKSSYEKIIFAVTFVIIIGLFIFFALPVM